MSAAEGKNCFREKWRTTPSYSGGPVAGVEVPLQQEGESEDFKLGVAVPNRSLLNLVDASTGEVLASYQPPIEDDLILHVDSCVANVPPLRTTANDLGALELGQEAEAADAEAATVRRSFIAISTRALQVIVLRLELVKVSPEAVPVTNEGDDMPTADAAPQDKYEYELQVVKQWTASQHAVGFLRFSPCGRYLASGATDGNVKIWSVHHHYLTHNFRVSGGIVTYIAFQGTELAASVGSATSMLDDSKGDIVVGSFEGYVSIFSLEKKTLLAVKRLHNSPIECLFINTKGLVTTLGRDRKITRCFSPLLENTQETVVVEHFGASHYHQHDSKHLHLHLGTNDGALVTYNVPMTGASDKIASFRRRAAPIPAAPKTEEEEQAEDEMGEEAIRAFAYYPTASHRHANLIACDASQTLHWYNLVEKSFEYRHAVVCHLDQVLDMAVLPASANIAGTPNSEGHSFRRLVLTNSKVANVYEGAGCVTTETLIGHTDVVLSAVVSKDGEWIFTGSKDCTVRCWSALSLSCCGVGARAHTADVVAVQMNQRPNEQNAVTGYSVSIDASLKVWDLTPCRKALKANEGVISLKTAFGIEGAHDGGIHCLAVAPNDSLVVTAGKDRALNVWNVTGKKLQKQAAMKGHKRGINCVQFSPVDRLVASGSNDSTIKIWSMVTFTCSRTLLADRGGVMHTCFFNNGQQLVSGGGEGILRIWALASGESVAAVECFDEKLWALTVIENGPETFFLGGSAGGEVVVVEDYTAEEAQRLRDLNHQTILEEQALSDAMFKKDWGAAFKIALSLSHPRHLRGIVSQWLATEPDCIEDDMAVLIRGLSDTLREKLLVFTRSYATNVRFSNVSAVILGSFVTAFPLDRLVGMTALQQILEALWSYTRRHHSRQKQHLQQLHYVDYLCRSLHMVGADQPVSTTGAAATTIAEEMKQLLPSLAADKQEQEEGAAEPSKQTKKKPASKNKQGQAQAGPAAQVGRKAVKRRRN